MRRTLAATAATTAVPIAALAADAHAAEEGASPYGELGDRDGLGVLLPPGFQVQVVAVSGQVVPGTSYVWRDDPDGAATFDDGFGGWFHVVNHETDAGRGGGVSVLHFNSDGVVGDAYSILTGTNRNCAGGPTPWGTWLSCEEVADGQVYECFPGSASQGHVLPALGTFNHEAVAVDPVRRQLYLTEDRGDGLLYRFTPDAYPDLSSGLLEAANFSDGAATWVEIPDPTAASEQTRYQLPGNATTFAGGEGIWYYNDRVYFTTKGDNGVWDLHLLTGQLTRVWAGNASNAATDQLTGVDNITVENGSGDLFVAEDGGNMELVLITAQGAVSPFLRVEGQDGSEVTGPCFSPDGNRLFFSSQRGRNGDGVTYMVSGPFRGVDQSPASPSPEPSAEPTVAVSPTAAPSVVATARPDVSIATPTAGVEVTDQEVAAARNTPQAADPMTTPTTIDDNAPDPSSTLTRATESKPDDSATIVLGAAAVAAGVAGAALVGLRRRQDEVLDS